MNHKRYYIPFNFTLIFFFLVFTTIVNAATRTCVASGNWTSIAIWSGGLIPTNTDDVVIGNGFSVTINADANAKSVTVGGGTSGSLIFESLNTRTLNVTNDVTINAGASFTSNTTGNASHFLNVGGGIVNNGILDFYSNVNRYVTIRFSGATSKTFSGTGGTTDVYKITLNKGSSIASVLELTTSNFSVRGSVTNGTDFLTLTNGLFKLSGSFTGSSIVFAGSNYSIVSTAGFCLNNSNYTVNAQNGYLSLYGKLMINAGTYNIGTDQDDDLAFWNSSVFEMNGGVLNVAESIYSGFATSSACSYLQTGGIVNVGVGGINPYSNKGLFHLEPLSSFTFSGGYIVLRNPSTASSASDSYDYYNFAATKTITGGTVQFGDASTSGAKTFNVSGGYFPHLLINNAGGNHQVNLSTLNSISPEVFLTTTLQNNTKLDAGLTYGCDMTFHGAITIGTGATYYQAARTHTWKGDFTNNGTFSTTTGSVLMNGTTSQTIVGTAAATMYNLTINNTNGVVISKGPTVSNLLTFTSGNITAASSSEPITLGVAATVSGNGDGKCVVGYCAKNTNTTAKFTFPVGASTTQRTMSVTPSSTSATTWLVKYFPTGYADQSITGVDLGSVSTSEYWTVDRSGSANSTIELTWNAASGITDVSKVWVAHYNGSDWEAASGEGGAGSLTAGVKTSTTNWTSYSPFTFGFSSDGTVLPIELLSFTAKKNKNEVLVSWKTATEIHNDYFTIERSFDGHHFSPIARLAGAGNSSQPQYYHLEDKDFVNGINYYKLVQTDYNGEETISDIVAVDMTTSTETKIKTINLIGQDVNEHFSGIVYDIYSDGSSVKRMQ